MKNLLTDSIKQLPIKFYKIPVNKRKAVYLNLKPLLA